MAAAETQTPLPEATDRAPVSLMLLWLLAGLAGAIDARGIVLLHDIFLSFMSGNSTMLAVNIAREDWPHARLIATVVGTFVTGAAFGQAIAELSGQWRLPVVVALVTLVLVLPPVLPLIEPLVMPRLGFFPGGQNTAALVMTFAMGALNAAMVRAGSVAVSITFVTGALVRFGQGVGALLVGRTGGWNWLAQTVPWSGLMAGAIMATLASAQPASHIDTVLPIFASVLTMLAAVATWRRRPRRLT